MCGLQADNADNLTGSREMDKLYSWNRSQLDRAFNELRIALKVENRQCHRETALRACDLTAWLLQRKPKDRPQSFKEVLGHSFFRGKEGSWKMSKEVHVKVAVTHSVENLTTRQLESCINFDHPLGKSVLHTATLELDADLVRLIIEQFYRGSQSMKSKKLRIGIGEGEVNLVDFSGNSPLHALLSYNVNFCDMKECLQLLTDVTDLDFKNADGKSVLDLGVASECPETRQFFIEQTNQRRNNTFLSIVTCDDSDYVVKPWGLGSMKNGDLPSFSEWLLQRAKEYEGKKKDADLQARRIHDAEVQAVTKVIQESSHSASFTHVDVVTHANGVTKGNALEDNEVSYAKLEAPIDGQPWLFSAANSEASFDLLTLGSDHKIDVLQQDSSSFTICRGPKTFELRISNDDQSLIAVLHARARRTVLALKEVAMRQDEKKNADVRRRHAGLLSSPGWKGISGPEFLSKYTRLSPDMLLNGNLAALVDDSGPLLQLRNRAEVKPKHKWKKFLKYIETLLGLDGMAYYRALLESCERRTLLTDYRFVRKLGAGGFGQVSLCSNRHSYGRHSKDEQKAIKVVMPAGGEHSKAFLDAQKETELQQRVAVSETSEYIAKIFAWGIAGSSLLWVSMEFCELGARCVVFCMLSKKRS